MRPRLNQKCDRQPCRNHMEGCSVGRPAASTRRFHRGLTSRISINSIVFPQPHGQRMPTHQSSSSSRARMMSRRGKLGGNESPATITSLRAGSTRSVSRRHPGSHFMRHPIASDRTDKEALGVVLVNPHRAYARKHERRRCLRRNTPPRTLPS